jgi:hypothetical protein
MPLGRAFVGHPAYDCLALRFAPALTERGRTPTFRPLAPSKASASLIPGAKSHK